MQIHLENIHMKITIDTLGAELISFIHLASGYEHIWQGNPQFWTGHSPVLFPIIGSLNNNQISIDGKSYTMGNHGFARRSEFQVISQEEHKAHFRLTNNEDTLKLYPYEFQLDLIYTLIGTAVSITYQVTNLNKKVLPFQLGTHPAFNCPMQNTEHLEDWYLEFEKKETLHRIKVLDNLLDFDSTQLVLDDSALLPLKQTDFHDGAIVFKGVESSHVTLKSDRSERFVTVSFNNFPDLAIWQPVDAPFICIEPWYGHGDPLGFEGDILEKFAMIHLDPEATYQAELRIRIE